MDGEVQYVSEFEDRYHFHLFIFGILSTYVILSVDNYYLVYKVLVCQSPCSCDQERQVPKL
jgi:hypothetical protein